MKNLFILIALLFNSSIYAIETQDDEYTKMHDFLEIAKNYLDTQSVHKNISESERTLTRLNHVNFSQTPRVVAIKPFDSLQVHYAYPLKIFFPEGATVTSAILSNTDGPQPSKSQNLVTVTVPNDFESGLLDVTYVEGGDLKKGKLVSIKLDKYVYATKQYVKNNKLYTQVRYVDPKILNQGEILANLKKQEFANEHSEVFYMGIQYDIYLVSIIKDNKTVKRYKDDKYITGSLEENGTTYNYYVPNSIF